MDALERYLEWERKHKARKQVQTELLREFMDDIIRARQCTDLHDHTDGSCKVPDHTGNPSQ